MSSAGTRERVTPLYVDVPGWAVREGKKLKQPPLATKTLLANGKQITVSSSNRFDRKLGHYNSGGDFYTSRVSPFVHPGHVGSAVWPSGGSEFVYSGPICCQFPTSAEMSSVGYSNPFGNYGSKNESGMQKDGTVAIGLCSPTNPASNLGTTLAESMREGIPSLPGIQTWKRRTELLKGVGSEFLNAEFGWLPLVDEVGKVATAARYHRDIMNSFHEGEGSDTHRSFYFPSQSTSNVISAGREWPMMIGVNTGFLAADGSLAPERTVSLVRETKRWFEGCFTYASPAQTDSWQKALGFGSQADHLFGISLSPQILWELTPWSWAVDWFSNVGFVVRNLTQMGLAGLVLRYGYMMEESIERVTAEVGDAKFRILNDKSEPKYATTSGSGSSAGIESVTKRRVPASPFGFSVGWEGLSPTQLAITAALGITRLL